MIVKVHEKDGRVLVAVTDSNLIGKKFSEGNIRLDLTSDFYKGEEKTEEETGDLIRNADHVNLVGKKAIELAVKEGIIEEENIITIQEISHAQGTILHE